MYTLKPAVSLVLEPVISPKSAFSHRDDINSTEVGVFFFHAVQIGDSRRIVYILDISVSCQTGSTTRLLKQQQEATCVSNFLTPETLPDTQQKQNWMKKITSTKASNKGLMTPIRFNAPIRWFQFLSILTCTCPKTTHVQKVSIQDSNNIMVNNAWESWER